ncbi:superoxide dismutase [Mn], mitochondrial-like protein, partial [Tanacetum coccineum]
ELDLVGHGLSVVPPQVWETRDITKVDLSKNSIKTLSYLYVLPLRGWRAIDQHFGLMEKLISKMSAEGAAVQGSGWVWLAADKELKRLVVETTVNQYETKEQAVAAIKDLNGKHKMESDNGNMYDLIAYRIKLCTLEFETRCASYYWLLDALSLYLCGSIHA